jgi:hypothetical protein
MLQRGVMAACGSKAIWARHCPGLRPFYSPRGVVTRSTTIASDVAAAAPAATVAAPAFKANLDFKFVKENVQLVADNCKARNASADPARVAALYDEFTRLKQECDSLRASRNENSSAMKVGDGAMHWLHAIVSNERGQGDGRTRCSEQRPVDGCAPPETRARCARCFPLLLLFLVYHLPKHPSGLSLPSQPPPHPNPTHRASSSPTRARRSSQRASS